MAQINQICVDPISCHAYSANFDRLALSSNTNLVHIYKHQDPSWIEETVLSQHDMQVTSIDWAPKTNRIVTCSADRNAYVWLQDSNSKWEPSLVLLRINRAATCVKWSPNEDKFALGTSAKLVCVCFFESANNWWVSKHIKKPIKSTITSLDWHPNNMLLACGSTDFRARIFSTFNTDIDKDCFHQSCWNKFKQLDKEAMSTLGSLIAEFSNIGSWVHNVAFSPDGTKLAWVAHDSSISVVDPDAGLAVVTLKTRYLPFLACLWVSNKRIVAAGHDCCPMLFSYETNCNTSPKEINGLANSESYQLLKFMGRLDRSQKKEADDLSAMRKFKDLDARGPLASCMEEMAVSTASEVPLGTIHQNTINQIRSLCRNSLVVDKLATIGLDGKLVVWSLDHSVL